MSDQSHAEIFKQQSDSFCHTAVMRTLQRMKGYSICESHGSGLASHAGFLERLRRVGKSYDHIEHLQTILKNLKYYGIPISHDFSYYESDLREAIRQIRMVRQIQECLDSKLQFELTLEGANAEIDSYAALECIIPNIVLRNSLTQEEVNFGNFKIRWDFYCLDAVNYPQIIALTPNYGRSTCRFIHTTRETHPYQVRGRPDLKGSTILEKTIEIETALTDQSTAWDLSPWTRDVHCVQCDKIITDQPDQQCESCRIACCCRLERLTSGGEKQLVCRTCASWMCEITNEETADA